MCTRVYNRNTEAEVDTPKGLREMLGIEPVLDRSYQYFTEDSCLCQIDVEATAKKAGYNYEVQNGDYMDAHVWKGDHETPDS